MKYKKGDIVDAKIISIEKYGVFASLDEEYSGLIHISELSNDFVRDINKFGAVGETIYAKVIEVDEDTKEEFIVENGEVTLSFESKRQAKLLWVKILA